MSPTLTIQLLGGFHIRHGDTLVTAISSPRLQSLLVYLLLNARVPLSRQQIAFQLWPDSNEKQARGNLRRELHTLRQKLPHAEQFIHIEQRSVRWRADAPCAVDVWTFEADLSTADTATDPAEVSAALKQAVALYRGPLFPDCYDEWIGPERHALAQAYSGALSRLIHLLEADRQYDHALAQAQRLLHHDPLAEPTYRRLMRLHALNNDRAGALRVYHSCVTMLERELGVSPEAETEQLYRQLLKSTDRDPAATHAPKPRPAHSTLVGRDTEWAHLRTLWELSRKGSAQFVLVSGEAGIGKSQLTEEFERWVGRQGGAVATARLYEVEEGLAYTPVIEWLRSDLLQPVVGRMDDVWLTELARLLPELLTERPELPHPQSMVESRQRQRLFESVTRVFQAVDEPLLLLLDDMHWCDQETASWLQYLFSVWTQPPLLMAATVRPEEVSEAHPAHALWRDLRIQQRFHELALGPLNEAETMALAHQVASEPLNAGTIAHLCAESEGVPLFLVEMVRARLWDLGGTDEPSAAPAGRLLRSHDGSLPPQIQAVIETRLSRLSESARQIAALAATIGRSFDYDLLIQASGEDEDTVVEGLDELWQRRIIRELGAFSYIFSHDKIQGVAYGQLTTIRCRQLHRRVANALARAHAANLQNISGQLAFHYERAGLVEEAASWHETAAQNAEQIYAYTESMSHLRSALALLDTLPDERVRIEQKIDLLFSLQDKMFEVYGLVYVERGEILSRIKVLASHIKERGSWLRALDLLSMFHVARGVHDKALVHIGEYAQAIRESDDPGLRAREKHLQAAIAIPAGDFSRAKECFDQSLKMNPQEPRISAWLTLIYWVVGLPEQAHIFIQKLLKRNESHLQSLSVASVFASIIYQNMKLAHLFVPQIEIQEFISEQNPDWRFNQMAAELFRGWQLALAGQIDEGITLATRGVDELRQMGHVMLQTYRLAVLAEMHLMADQVNEAQMLLDEAFTLSQEKNERFWDVELHRLQGNLLLVAGDATAAEDAYHQAIEVAQSQRAKSLELRAVLHLCHLWQSQGRQADAHARLLEIYGWFSEGFDTGDLQEAQALLVELAERVYDQ